MSEVFVPARRSTESCKPIVQVKPDANQAYNSVNSEDKEQEDGMLSDDGQSVDLSALSDQVKQVSDEELLEIMASKHRFEDDGKIFHIAILDYLQDWNCEKKGETQFKPWWR